MSCHTRLSVEGEPTLASIGSEPTLSLTSIGLTSRRHHAHAQRVPPPLTICVAGTFLAPCKLQTRLPRTDSISLLVPRVTRAHTAAAVVHTSTDHRPVQRCRFYGPYFKFSCCTTPLRAHGNEMYRQGRSNNFFSLHKPI